MLLLISQKITRKLRSISRTFSTWMIERIPRENLRVLASSSLKGRQRAGGRGCWCRDAGSRQGSAPEGQKVLDWKGNPTHPNRKPSNLGFSGGFRPLLPCGCQEANRQ